MFMRVDTGLYINLENIIAIELEEPTLDVYNETSVYRWVFYTISEKHPVFYSQVFDTKEEALGWFDEVFGEVIERRV